MYGIFQEGTIWGSSLLNTVVNWGFSNLFTDGRLLMLIIETHFVLFVIVVDDHPFWYNPAKMLSDFEAYHSSTFSVEVPEEQN